VLASIDINFPFAGLTATCLQRPWGWGLHRQFQTATSVSHVEVQGPIFAMAGSSLYSAERALTDSNQRNPHGARAGCSCSRRA